MEKKTDQKGWLSGCDTEMNWFLNCYNNLSRPLNVQGQFAQLKGVAFGLKTSNTEFYLYIGNCLGVTRAGLSLKTINLSSNLFFCIENRKLEDISFILTFLWR